MNDSYFSSLHLFLAGLASSHVQLVRDASSIFSLGIFFITHWILTRILKTPAWVADTTVLWGAAFGLGLFHSPLQHGQILTFDSWSSSPSVRMLCVLIFSSGMSVFWAARTIVAGLSPAKPEVEPVPIPAVLFQVLCLTFMFACIYSFLGINGPANECSPVCHDLPTSLYFSIMTLTTVGYGDFTPTPLARPVAAVQALSGYLILALMIAVITERLKQRKN